MTKRHRAAARPAPRLPRLPRLDQLQPAGGRTIEALSCCDPYYADPEFRGCSATVRKGIAFTGADAAHA
jgi:hypothetical protein